MIGFKKDISIDEYNFKELYFFKALEKIGCPEKISKRLLNDISIYSYKYLPEFVYVAVESDSSHNSWYIKKDGFDFSVFDFKGKIELTTEDINDIEIELNMKKYNL